MSNGVEVIIASNKTKTLDNKHNDLSSQMSQPIDSNKPTTLAASTIKNQMMILLLSTLSTTMDQESYTQQLHIKLPFHTNHFITKTCLTTYTYCTTYVQEGETTVESREKVISNIATEERIYPKIEPSQTLGVTLTRTPDLAVGIFPTTYLYFNTFMDNSHNFQVMTSEHTVINTITGPEDYIAYLMPTAKATPVLETNTYYNKVTLMQTLKQPTTKYQEPITKINTIEEMLTEVIVTKSLPPARKTSNWATAEIIEKINDLDDIHIYATNTYLTTLTYYTTSLITNFVDESLTEKENIRPISTVFTYQTRIMENVLTDSIPIRLFPTEFVAKMKLELRKQKHQRQVIVTTATLKGGKTIKITAMNIMMASPGTFKTSTLLPVTIKEEPVKIWETDHQSSHLETILENTEFNKENQEIKSNQTQIAQEDNLPFVDNLEQGDHLKIENQISEQPDSLETLSSEQIPNTIEFPKNSTLNENFEFEITTAQPSATHNLIQRLTALRPMFNAMAGLWQNNFAKDGQEGVDLESKPTFNKKQMLNQSSETHPIYIPVQKPFPANSHLDNKMENHQDFIPLSLHIKPPLVNEMALETNDKDNWLRPPFGLTGQQLTSLEGFRQEQPLQNGIIYIHPGEIITANSDVIVGRPNGIEYNHKSSQLNRNREIISHQKPKQNQNPYYQPNMQQTSNIKNPSLLATLASAAATRPLQRLANRGTYRNKELNNKWESQNFALRPFNKPQKTLDDFNKNILKPPPLPNLITIPHNLNSYTLQTQFLKPFSNQAQPATSNLNNNLPAFQNKLIENIPQQSIRDLYHFHEPNKDMKNNEILDIQRIPEVFSTDLKPTHLNYKTYLTTKPSHMPQPNQHSALQIHENTILHQPDFYHEQILPTQTSTNLGTSQDFFNTDKEFSLTSITGMTATPVTRPEALQNHKTNKEIFEIFNTPILETSSKKRQHINLNKNTFSQTIDVNVPPLTFNKDPDYPQQNKPVKGQIQALIYTNQTNYMPLITVPLDKQQVQINLTPYHGISNIIPFAKAKPNHSEYSEKENVNETFPFFYNRNFFKNDQQGKQNQKIPASGNSQPDLDITPRWSPPYITHQISTSQNLKNYEILHKFPPTQMTLATFNTEAEPAPQQNWKAKQKFNNMPMSPKAEQHMEKSTNHESLSEIKENPKEFLKFVITNTEQKDEAKTIYKTKINLNTHRAEVDNADDKKNQKLFKHQDEPAKLEKFQTTATLNRYPEDLKNNFATTTATLSRHPEDLKNNFKTTTATLSIHPEDLKNHFATATAFNKEIFNQKNDSIRMWRPKQTQKASINTHSKQKQKTNEITNKINQQYQENFQSTSTSHSLSISIKSPPTNKKLSLNTDALKKEFEKPVPNRSQPFRKYSNNEKPNTPHKTVNQSAIFVAAGEAFKKASTEKSETFITELQTNKPKESNNKSQNIKQLNEIDKLPSQPLITTIKTANETASLTNSAQPTIMKNKTLGNFLKFHQKQLPDDQKREPDIKENPLNFLTKTSPVTPKTPNTETIPFQKQHPEKINLTKETDKKTLKLPEIEDPKMPIKEINFSLQPTQSYNNVASTTITSTRLYTKTKSSTTLKANVLTTKIITNKYGNTVTNTATPTLSDKTTTSQAKPTTLYIKTKTTQNPKITRTAVTSMQHTGSRLKEQTFINANIKPTITLKQNLTATEMRSTQMEIPSKSNVIDINHLPYPSIEIVSTNITKDLVQTESLHHLNKDKMENSIFIILGNNKNKSLLKSSIFTQITDTPFEMATDNGEIINESKEIVIDYDDSISFDSIITRDEQPITHVNGKSVLGNPKNINSDDSPSQNHVLLATPLKIPINHNRNMNLNVGNSSCRPECKSTRNEVCTLKDKHWTCICRPGFARMFPDRICKPTYTYALVMHAERVGNYPLQFVKELGDSTTEHFKQLSQLLVNALDRMLMQSDFRDAYHGVHLTQILDDEQNHQGIMAKFLLQLSDNTDEKRLEEVFRKYLRLSNYSIGGTDVYTNKDGVDALAINDFDECLSKQFHDCSNDARCFNLQGTYTCSCREGFADFSDNLIYPGRRCSSEQIGCEYCQYHGKCSVSSSTTNTWKKSNDYIICECFPWYSGAKCHVNLKILLIVLLGVGTILFILLLFCCLITCTKRQKHTTLATSTMTSTNASGSAVGSFHKNSRLATNMLITRVGVELCDSIENGFSSKNKRKKTIKLDKRSMIKDSSSETSQNSLPYALKTRESFAGIYNQTNSLHLSYRQKYSNYRSHTNGNEQHSVLSHQHLDSQDNFTPQQSNSQPLKNNGDTENYYCEQSDRSLTVMIPRAKYHSSVLPKNQLMHVTTDNDLMYVDRNSDLKCNQKQVSSTSSFTQMPSNPGALISAGFEVSAIVSDHANVISSLENNSIDVVCLEPTTTNNSDTSLDPFTSMGIKQDQKYIQIEGRRKLKSNQHGVTDNLEMKTEYNTKTCEKDLIDTMDEWLGNVKLNELSAEARSFGETTVRASTKHLRVCLDGIQSQPLNDEANTMAERDIGSTFLLPHTHLYKPERQESEMSGFDSF